MSPTEQKGRAAPRSARATRWRSRHPDFDHPVQDLPWQVPSAVWLDGDLLRYQVEPEDLTSDIRSNPWTRSGNAMLREFLDLESGEDASIEGFGRRWGVLGMCKHMMPWVHSPDAVGSTAHRFFGGRDSEGSKQSSRRCRPLQDGASTFDPLARWRDASRSSRAVLNLAAALRRGQHGRMDDWRSVIGFVPFEDRPQNLALMEAILASVVDQLLAVSSVVVGFTWGTGPPQVAFRTSTLAGGLALQLALSAASADGFAICSSCGSSFIPPRQPTEGRRRYCSACRAIRVPARDAKRDQRAGKSRTRPKRPPKT